MSIEDKHDPESSSSRAGGGPSWPGMLAWLGAAIAVAAGLAWLLIRPFLLPHR